MFIKFYLHEIPTLFILINFILLFFIYYLHRWVFWGLLASSILSSSILDLWLSKVAIMVQLFLFFFSSSRSCLIWSKHLKTLVLLRVVTCACVVGSVMLLYRVCSSDYTYESFRFWLRDILSKREKDVMGRSHNSVVDALAIVVIVWTSANVPKQDIFLTSFPFNGYLLQASKLSFYYFRLNSFIMSFVSVPGLLYGN